MGRRPPEEWDERDRARALDGQGSTGGSAASRLTATVAACNPGTGTGPAADLTCG
ncbi:MAG: hypothetical protein AVDCRST_MAG07-1616 [uncultured Frankineae bacterium]|uniref:Uncharacterized protein n=1 Tax=uncultured Frankineae bacterium TaxID=437475 RepID=A0A6J4L0H6_9ACTN|nr:MAG: hypothetical protein AVDCRST_MAG07-1616 [uncultured Frankineae bacterium]